MIVSTTVRSLSNVRTSDGWASLNQIVCALRFFYGITLGQNDAPERIPYARKPRTLPVVLSADEVVQLLEAVSSLKARVALTCAYAAGLRVGEVCGLKVEDIDGSRMVIHVRHGKGSKARYVMPSVELPGILRSYWRLARPGSFLFPGRDPGKPIEPTVLNAVCRSAVAATGLSKRVTVHTLRHSLRHASSGEWHGYPHHSGSARSRPSVEHGPLYAGF